MKTIANETAKKSFLAHEPKTQLEHYLAYYVGRSEPGYAVLVTGEWGTGKTYQVTKALPESHAYYVSLFGLSTPQDIEAAVFAKMFPGKAGMKKLADKIPAVNVGIPGAVSLPVSSLASSLANTFIKNTVDASKPLILDDLERCSIPPKQLLGIINRYVEHHKCRVIVIAHDEKIVDGFQEAKEKIFGQTIKIEPDIEAAFEHFNQTLVTSGREDFLGDLKSEVLHIFKESKHKSLRILRHVLEDAQRLMNCVEPRHRVNNAAMVEMVRLFAAVATEYRSNMLSVEDLKDRTFALIRRHLGSMDANTEAPRSAFQIVSDKYKSVNLTSEILSDDALSDTVIYGSYVKSKICPSLDQHPYFITPATSPNWRIVIDFDRLDDDVVLPALGRMNEQFERREILNSGEILHVIALKMMMADKKISQEAVPDVVAAAKSYIDDVLNQGRLPPRSAGVRWKQSFEESYDGIAYWVSDTYASEFNEIFDYLVSAIEKSSNAKSKELAPLLLETLKTDGEVFFEKVCHSNTGKIEFEAIPILAHITPKDFVDAWLEAPKNGWYWIGSALKERGKTAHHSPSLAPEIGWYEEVFKEMMRRSDAETGLAKVRLIRAANRMGVNLKKA